MKAQLKINKRVSDILNTKQAQERLYYILEEKGFIKTSFVAFMELVEKQGITKVLKSLGVYKTTGKGSERRTFADVYIWILLAMELNPMIYAKVIIWITDTLVFDRIEAGSEYLPMNNKIKGLIEKPNYALYAKMINEKVFGKHIAGMRNLASAKELRQIADIEKQIITAIDMNWIKNEKELLRYLKHNG